MTRVRVKEVSPASRPELQSPAEIFSSAAWIWPESHHWDLYNCYALFRKSFVLSRLPSHAPLFITADQSYQLYLNGTYICRGPARGFQKSWPYDEIDVRPWLKKGRNLIAVRAYNPGRSNFQYRHEGYAGLLIAARWGKTSILTDSSWRSRRQDGVNRNTVPSSIQLFPQEEINLQIEDPDWMMPSYREDRRWKAKVYTAPWNAMPWSGLEPRGIPLLEEAVMHAASCIGKAGGSNHPHYLQTRDLAKNRYHEGLAHRPASLPSGALKFPASGDGRWHSFLIDFGRVVVGSLIVEISGAQGGEMVETLYGETIDPPTRALHFLPDTHCRIAFAQRLTCRPGTQKHQFYLPVGFRYLVLTVRNNQAPLTVGATARSTLYPHQQRGFFHSSDAGLEKIWNACAWTERICSMDAYVDTPWREQAQWWGDARVQAWNTFHYSGDHRLFRRGIRQIAAQTTPSGLTYGHAPTVAHTCILPDFTLIWMATLWDDYWQTGSLASFLGHQDTITKALAYFREWTDPKVGLLKHDRRYWLFLDWTNVQKDGHSSVYSLWLLYALERLVEMYRLAGFLPEAARCKKWALSLRKSLRKLVSPDGLMRDGILPNGTINPHCSIHAQTLSLMNRLSPRQEKIMMEKSLLLFIRGQLQSKIQPSSYWITYVYTELAQRGYGREVVAHITREWAVMAEYGSTWENFRPDLGNESHSHAWSAHPLFHLMQIIGGIRQTAPGWKEIAFSPQFIGNHAEVTVPTLRGPIKTSWRRNRNAIDVQLRLPKGVDARISLPGNSSPASVSGRATPFKFSCFNS